jgi:hypothetical protein
VGYIFIILSWLVIILSEGALVLDSLDLPGNNLRFIPS